MDIERLRPEQRELGSRIWREAEVAGVDPALAVSIAFQESSLDPNTGGTQIKKPDGSPASSAQGVFQLIERNRKHYGVGADVDSNIKGGLSLIRDLMKQHDGDVAKVISAYKSGSPDWSNNEETRKYGSAVWNRMESLRAVSSGNPPSPSAQPTSAPKEKPMAREEKDYGIPTADEAPAPDQVLAPRAAANPAANPQDPAAAITQPGPAGGTPPGGAQRQADPVQQVAEKGVDAIKWVEDNWQYLLGGAAAIKFGPDAAKAIYDHYQRTRDLNSTRELAQQKIAESQRAQLAQQQFQAQQAEAQRQHQASQGQAQREHQRAMQQERLAPRAPVAPPGAPAQPVAPPTTPADTVSKASQQYQAQQPTGAQKNADHNARMRQANADAVRAAEVEARARAVRDTVPDRPSSSRNARTAVRGGGLLAALPFIQDAVDYFRTGKKQGSADPLDVFERESGGTRIRSLKERQRGG